MKALLVAAMVLAMLRVARADEEAKPTPLEKLRTVTISEFTVDRESITNAVRLLNSRLRLVFTNTPPPTIRVEVGPTRLIGLPKDAELARTAQRLFDKAISRYRTFSDIQGIPSVSLRTRNWPALEILTTLAREAGLWWWESGDDILLRSNPRELVCGTWQVQEELVQAHGLDQAENADAFFLQWPPRYDKDAVVWVKDRRVLIMVQHPYIVEHFAKMYELMEGRMQPAARVMDETQQESGRVRK